MSDPQAAFAEALAAFQSAIPHIGKDQKANAGQYAYSYAGLEDIAPKTLAALAQQGLSWTAKPDLVDGAFVLVSSLLHTAGHRESGTYPLPDPSKANPQQIGSAITYARRYSFCALTGITPGGDDDDGARALDARSAAPQQPRARKAPEPPKASPAETAAWLVGWRERVVLAEDDASLVKLWQELAPKARTGEVDEETATQSSELWQEKRAELRQGTLT